MMDQNELRETESLCIQEAAPPCVSACPIHVDVREMAAALRQGDLDKALKVLKKTLPFPGIIGRICDQPCRNVCTRIQAGDAIAIANLERACADLGASPGKVSTLPARGKQAAIIGGGLSGLTAAFDLARKGWGVTIFEAKDRLGGRLWEYPESVLPRHVIENDLAVIKNLGIRVEFGTPVGPELTLANVRSKFNTVYVAVGAAGNGFLGLEQNEDGSIRSDPLTFAVGFINDSGSPQDGVFTGGSLLRSPSAYSPILSISDGRRSATSIERYLQGASLTAARQNEGSYPSLLYTNTAGIEPLPVITPSDANTGYNKDEATQEAQRCLLCECMECVKVCEFLSHYRSYPKKYVREIYNNLSIVAGQRHSNQLINSCSLCGLCAEVCPNDLSMAGICRQARRTMIQQKRMPPSAHDFALRDMAFSASAKFAMSRNQPGTTGSDYAFFPGCQLAGSAPEQVEHVYDYLCSRLGARVGLVLDCCGAPADWAGRDDLSKDVLASLNARFKEMGSPRLILACSSCYQVFKSHLPDVELVSLWEVFTRYGLPDKAPASTRRLVIHDPCTTRYERAMQDSARQILAQLGYEIGELPLNREKTECCSYGGLMWFANRTLAQQVIDRRIEASPLDYVTYCATCRDFFASRGKRTLHLLDLVFSSDLDRQANRPNPGYSGRHENRARLKRNLLKKYWGEKMPDQEEYETIQLEIPEGVRKLMEERLVLIEDIQQVIAYAERTGQKFEKASGHYLAFHSPSSVTYWVEYTQKGDSYAVHNAYSHRMQVGKGAIQ